MHYPPPSNSSAQPALTPADPPAGPPMKPKLTEAEVLYTDRKWHPATVLGWYELDDAHEQLLTGLLVSWLVRLRLESGKDSWFEYAKLNIRPRSGRVASPEASNQLSNDRGRQRRTPADERGPRAADQSEDAKA